MKRILLSAALITGTLLSTASYAQTALTNSAVFTTSDITSPIITSSNDNDLLVYPNPVISSTRIVLDEVPTSPVSVDVIDLNGQIDRTFQYAQGSYQLDVDMSNLPTGLYSVRVSGRDIGYHNLKVVKE